MNIILNDHIGTSNFAAALGELVKGCDTLSVAVSYLQMSGWELFRRQTSQLNFSKMRMVCTDQLGITHPTAVRRAKESGIQIRNFDGKVTYHPKVYMAHDVSGRPTKFLLASSNLSYSAFTNSIEAGVLGSDPACLKTLHSWFEQLFRSKTQDYTELRLREMEVKWKATASGRTRARLRVRRMLVASPGLHFPPSIESEDLDAMEDVFSTVQLPIGLLNIDYARNNIRNLQRIMEVISEWDSIRKSSTPTAAKQRSELKLLGFAHGADLTRLGRAAATATSREEVARMWCGWLQTTPAEVLKEINPKLLVAVRVFTQFWRLKSDVREFFLAGVDQSADRLDLQTIELLCNSRAVVEELSEDDIKTLSPLLERPERLPEFVRYAFAEYKENKGMRGWNSPDRKIMPLAWKEATGKS